MRTNSRHIERVVTKHGIKVLNFPFGKVTEGPQRKAVKRKLPKRNAAQLHHGKSHSIEHAAHNTVTSDMKLNLNPCIVARELQDCNTVRSGETVLKLNPFLKFLELRRRILKLPPDFCVIYAWHIGTRMHQAIGKLSVICQEKQPFRVPVEAANGKDAGHAAGQKINHGRPTFRIIKRCHAFRRFVKQNIVPFRRIKNRFVVNLNATFSRRDEHPLFRDDTPANLNPSLINQFFCMTPARDTRHAQKLLEPHFFRLPCIVPMICHPFLHFKTKNAARHGGKMRIAVAAWHIP